MLTFAGSLLYISDTDLLLVRVPVATDLTVVPADFGLLEEKY